ncbi:MAG TPA: winged helix-turn-helix domain-containing protein [Chloroflexia bacterium]|nr:winged helix-turn-helix domain-containing protein [Chloroflexia bacterium]
MLATPDLAAVAALIADPSRAAMLAALLGGISLPAGELARLARISPQTASSHLSRLVEGGLLAVRINGRHRYYQLSSPQVAHALEALALVAPAPRVASLGHSLEIEAVRKARTCYNHLAGRLGVTLTQTLIEKGYLLFHEEAYELSQSGEDWFSNIGVEYGQSARKRANFARTCLDWSERKPHLAGPLGVALTRRLFKLEWIVRVEGSRGVKVTPFGRQQLELELGMEWPG